MLSWLDWCIIGVMALSVVVGLWRGFVREVFSILIWALAIWLAFRFSGLAASWVEGWVSMPEAQMAIGFVGILVVTLVIGGLAVWLISRLVDSTGLSGTDRMLGMVFGVVRGVAIIVVAMLVARLTPFPEAQWWQQSHLLPHFQEMAEYSTRWLPENLQQALDSQTPSQELDTEPAPVTDNDADSSTESVTLIDLSRTI